MPVKSFLQNKNFINAVFFILVIFVIFSFGKTFMTQSKEFNIPVFGKIDADIRINIEMPKNLIPDIHILLNGIELKPYIMKTKNSYTGYDVNNRKIYNMALKIDGDNKEEKIKNIKNMVITVGRGFYYYTGDDILKFDKDKNGYYKFPNDIKYYKNSGYITDKGPLKHFFIYFLSIFYNSKFYILPLLGLIASFLIYINNKDKITLGFNMFKTYAIWWVMLSALILRLSDNNFTFWTDELYTATCASYINDSFLMTFSDPGNPPLFFILAKIWMMIFGNNEGVCRILPCIFSILTVGIIYIFSKENLDKKTALLTSFLFAINIYSIYSAQEFRAYSLCALFSILSAYYLFKIIKNKQNKDFIIYAIIAILMANTHYFQILILTGNFIYAIFKLDNKSRIKFFICNLLAAFSFIPYFLMTAFNKALLDNSFNVLVKPEIKDIINIFSKFYAGKILAFLVLLIAFCIFIPKIKAFLFREDKNYFNIYLYSVYSILFLFAASYLISQIRPVIREYYFINVLPFIVITIAMAIFAVFKKNIISIIFAVIVIIFYFGGSDYIEKNRTSLTLFENLFKYAYYDSKLPEFKKYKKGIMMHDFEKYKRQYRSYLNNDDEIIMYKYPSDTETLIKKIAEAKSDLIYLRLEYKTFKEFVSTCSQIYDVSVIRTDKDILIARIVKR